MPATAPADAAASPRSFAGARAFLTGEARRLARDEGVAIIFVGKALLASAIALWIGFALDLTNPRWSLVSIFIVIQPESGLVLEKGFYRIVATLLGCVVSLVLVGAFAQHGELFLGALAIWVGVCVAASLRFRNYRAYAWSLVSYTACIVGLPAALAPDDAFNIAVARATEIGIGVACAGLVSALVFPRTSGDRLMRQARALFEDFTAYAGSVFVKPDDAAADEAAQERFMDSLAAQETAMSAAAFEDPHNPGRVVRVRRMNRTFARLATRLHLLRQLRRRLRGDHDALTAAIDELGARLVLSPKSGDAPEKLARALRDAREKNSARAGELRAGMTDADRRLDFDTHAELADDFLDGFADYTEQFSRLDDPSPVTTDAEEPEPTTRVDWLLAGVAGLRATLAIGVLSAFWIATNWPDGATAITFGMISYALCASSPRPVSLAWKTLVACLLAIPAGFVFRFVLMSAAHDFTGLFLTMSPFLAVSAYFFAKPKHFLTGLFFTVWFFTLAGPENNPSPDLTVFVGQSLAALAGIAVGLLMLTLVLPNGSEWVRRRLRRELRRQVVRACLEDTAGLAHDFEHATRAILRKIAVNRDAGAGSGRESRMHRWSFASLEIGGAMIEFRRALGETTPDETETAAALRVRAGVARAFARPSSEHREKAANVVSEAISVFQTQSMNRPSAKRHAETVTYLHLLRTALLDPASPLDDGANEAPLAVTLTKGAVDA